ncbi:MAG: 4'-phosphopantetheinyl transferase superfamily protein [Oscillospiraceae bacterium]|jgi:4'-phosphopantetheinyl transferase|nr:4'-phosphopantetheinyl transferase superfamily protein [Oscillospiraceae bacterium]
MPQLHFEVFPGADTHTLSVRGYDLAREFAADASGLAAELLRFERAEHGKPYFSNAPEFHFSLSHSGEALALAVHNAPVGVDIERLREPDFRIARRYFTRDEQEYIGKDSVRFFEIWTKKEAYLKYTGEGLRRTLNSFSVTEQADVVFTNHTRDGYMVTTAQRSSL